MAKHLVMIAIILVMLFIPVMASSMMLGYLKSNSDMVCNYKAGLSIIFGSNVEETLKIACAPEVVASNCYGGGGSQWSCGGTNIDPATLTGTPTKAYEEGKNTVVYEYPDGSHVSFVGGTLAWRNNNPGNIRPGTFTTGQGAIGSSGGFATFKSYEDGFNAIKKLMQTNTYKNLTMGKAITTYAPPVENNTEAYISNVEKSTGISRNKIVNKFTDSELEKFAKAIEKMEGTKPGTITQCVAATAGEGTTGGSGIATGGGGSGSNIANFALETTKDIEANDGPVHSCPRMSTPLATCNPNNITTKGSTYSKTPERRNWDNKVNGYRYASCDSFVQYAINATYDKGYPQGGPAAQRDYINKNPELYTPVAPIGKYSNLQPGDILFQPNHTAIYIGNGKTVEASAGERGPVYISNPQFTSYSRITGSTSGVAGFASGAPGIASGGACSSSTSTGTGSTAVVPSINPKGSGVIKNYKGLIPTNNNAELNFDQMFGDALLAAVKEGEKQGIKIVVFSGSSAAKTGHTTGSRHYVGMAADINTIAGATCFKGMSRGGCKAEVVKIMNKYNLFNPYCSKGGGGFTDGDCNHFQF